MTPEQRAAFVVAQAACAQAETFAMQSQNFMDARENKPLTYSYADFIAIQDRYVIGHNAVISFMAHS